MGTVVTYAPDDGDGRTQHEIAARVGVARTLAALKGFDFGGGYEPSLKRNGALYFVPSQTLSTGEARGARHPLSVPPQVLTAIGRAQALDAAAAEFDGLFASRRNYDVLRGRDAQDRWHCGALEQSWRIGGASGPEVAALAAFRTDPALRAVHARSTEAYDADAAVPKGAIVHFRGVDSRAGPMTKYTVVEPYARAR